ncbi:hypothetical protein SAMN05192532_103320 [Alteribacillus iranensis]|nr:hypothetical protein SAMN05192532_103320 [Alteribacillus iranensis]
MIKEEFQVYVEDTSGNVVINETMTSFDNGFVDLWLPRDDSYHVTITHDGKSAESKISTSEGDRTCITDMQLR